MDTAPLLFVYKEIVVGDLRKLLAESNNSTTGGGARDLRLPWRTFRPVMHKIFPTETIGKNGRTIRTADVTYLDPDDSPHHTKLEYWPATPSRPSEDRIAKVHASPALGGKMPDSDKGRVFLVLTKFDNGMVRCDYAYEDELKNGEWAPEVSRAIFGCVASAAAGKGNRTVQGYYNFLDAAGFCHAD